MASAPSPQHPPSNPLPSPSRPSPTRREIERAVQAPLPDPPRSPNRLLARPLVCPANNAAVREETAADARSSTPGRRQGPRRCRDLPPRRGSSSPLGTPPSHPSAAARQDWRGWGWGWRKWTWTWRTTGRWTWRWRCSWRRQDGRRWLAPTATRTMTSAPSASTSRRTTPTSHTLRSVNLSHVRPAQLRGGCGRSWRWKSGEPGAPRDPRRSSTR